MNKSKSTLLMDVSHVRYLVAAVQDDAGKTSFSVRFADKTVRFRSFSSVIDFIEMNIGSFGYLIA